jgi:spermidine/putrescine-binding protein
MARFWKIFFLAIIFSFGWGAWWGFFNYEKEHPHSAMGSELRILAELGFFTPTFAADIEKSFKVHLAITEKPTLQEYLREALSHYQDYDIIEMPTFALKSFLIDNLFQPLDGTLVNQFTNISIDFHHLDFDPDDKYLVPLSWSISGFLIDAKEISLSEETLSEILGAKAKMTLLNSPIELFSLASKLKPMLANWVETDQATQIAQTLKDLRNKNLTLSADPRDELKSGDVQVAQIQQGRAARLVGNGSRYRFVLPKERGTLKISFIGVSKGARDKSAAEDFISILLRPAWNKKLVEQNEEAAVVIALNESELPLLQKPSFIRNVPLSRVDLFINHEALEPTWLQALAHDPIGAESH